MVQTNPLFHPLNPSSPFSPQTPTSSASSTFVMQSTPRHRRAPVIPYKPQIITTVGVRPACLVNASVTYVGNDQIYAFGGFDQYTDEVYNHVLRLNLQTKQWNLVDNYGDIPGVRMGHTANLWQKDKLLVYAGENEHRAYLSDVIVFDLNTANWTQPKIHGIPPKGRARHTAFIHDDKLWISGGMTGPDITVLDDIFYLDLKTWTWSKVWKFVPRYDHSIWFHSGKMYAFGGMSEEMEKNSNLWWIDFKSNPNSKGTVSTPKTHTPTSLHTANSSYKLSGEPPGTVSMLKFLSSPELPSQNVGQHFHVYTSGYLLDFVTPSADMIGETSLSALDLETLTWYKLADGKDIFNADYQWHYCTLNEEGTQSWLLGHSPEPSFHRNENSEEFLSDVLHINLERLGVIGNSLHQTIKPTSDTIQSASPLAAIGADLSLLFDQPPEVSSSDFEIIAEADDESNLAAQTEPSTPGSPVSQSSQPIHVHCLILQARWPHFARLWSSQMREFHTRKLMLPEPYTTVRAFLYYLYTDSIAANTPAAPDLTNIAGMLVMANMYDMPRLRALCVDRLSKELCVDYAATIWERAGVAGEDWLRARATKYIRAHWGKVVRTEAYRLLSQESMVELCVESTDEDGKVVISSDVVERERFVGHAQHGVGVRRRVIMNTIVADDDDEDLEGVEMDVN
jgi:N-acetylneuraminic acid mutarotase